MCRTSSPAEGVEEAQRALDRAGARAAVGAALAAKTRRALDELAEQRKGVRGRPDKAHTTKKRRLEDALTRLDAGWLPGDEPPRPPVTLVGAALAEAVRTDAPHHAAPAGPPVGPTRNAPLRKYSTSRALPTLVST